MSGCGSDAWRDTGDLVSALRSCGSDIEHLERGSSSLPLRVNGGGFRGGEVELEASISSQFVSSLLLTAPYAQEQMTLKLRSDREVVSRPYIDMTVKLMRQFGIEVQQPDDYTVREYLPTFRGFTLR